MGSTVDMVSNRNSVARNCAELRGINGLPLALETLLVNNSFITYVKFNSYQGSIYQKNCIIILLFMFFFLFQDVRLTTLDHCSKMNPCKNSGIQL